MTVTVVIADHQPLIGRPLSTVDGIRVVAEASTGPEAVRAVWEHRPQVLVLDLQLEQGTGIATIREVRRAGLGTAVLVVTTFDDDATVRAAFNAGARGYLVKGTERAGIVPAIRGTAAGAVIFGTGIAGRIARLIEPVSAPGGLTSREREILDLLGAGMSNKAIARQLDLAPKTVSNRLTSIFDKLRVTNRTAAIAMARDGC
jgi:DNA-binding NarL/FixJ family response regulator